MIRVNLNRSRVQTGAEGESAAPTFVPDVGVEATNTKDTIIKLILIVIGTLGLWIYEKQNIDQLSSQASVVSGQLNKLKGQVAQKQAELAQLKDIEPQAAALNDKLKILRKYSKERLENLQSLDYLQSVIPDRVWLTALNYESQRYKMSGNAMDTIDLTEFVNKLEGSAYFQDVIVVQDREKAVQPSGKVREFELTARSGVKE